MKANNHTCLKRELSWWDCSSIIVSIMIGTGIFSVFPALIAQQNPSTLMVLLAWLCGGVFAWCGAMCYAELSSVFIDAGGDYVFLRNIYSYKGENIISFLFAWAQVFVIRPASIALLALIVGEQVAQVSGQAAMPAAFYVLATALVVTGLVVSINIRGLRVSKQVQNVITFLKIASILAIIGLGLLKTVPTDGGLAPLVMPAQANGWKVLGGFWSAMVLTMWVYGGWNEAVYVSEESKDPCVDIPISLFAGIFLSALLYLGVNLVYLKNFSPQGLANTWTPASDLMTRWFGPQGGVIASGVIIVSALGAIHGLTLTGGRMTYAVAKDYPVLKAFSTLHPRFQTPHRAILINFLLSALLLALSGGKINFVENLTFYTAGVFWYFFALVVISLILMRMFTPDSEIPFKVPFYPVLPVLFLLITAGLIWGSIKYKPVETLAGISVLTLGLPLYYFLNFQKEEYQLRKKYNAEWRK